MCPLINVWLGFLVILTMFVPFYCSFPKPYRDYLVGWRPRSRKCPFFLSFLHHIVDLSHSSPYLPFNHPLISLIFFLFSFLWFFFLVLTESNNKNNNGLDFFTCKTLFLSHHQDFFSLLDFLEGLPVEF